MPLYQCWYLVCFKQFLPKQTLIQKTGKATEGDQTVHPSSHCCCSSTPCAMYFPKASLTPQASHCLAASSVAHQKAPRLLFRPVQPRRKSCATLLQNSPESVLPRKFPCPETQETSIAIWNHPKSFASSLDFARDSCAGPSPLARSLPFFSSNPAPEEL